MIMNETIETNARNHVCKDNEASICQGSGNYKKEIFSTTIERLQKVTLKVTSDIKNKIKKGKRHCGIASSVSSSSSSLIGSLHKKPSPYRYCDSDSAGFKTSEHTQSTKSFGSSVTFHNKCDDPSVRSAMESSEIFSTTTTRKVDQSPLFPNRRRSSSLDIPSSAMATLNNNLDKRWSDDSAISTTTAANAASCSGRDFLNESDSSLFRLSDMSFPELNDANHFVSFVQNLESVSATTTRKADQSPSLPNRRRSSTPQRRSHHRGSPTDDEEEEDARSLDLDLATAREMFRHQHVHEQLQLHLTKTDELLHSVFPKHVAETLRNGHKVAPENHDLVTICFLDIVGFTDISSQLDPLEISDLLDRLYNSFDALSDYHDVFKVETIGDAYMAVTNLTKNQPDHCKRITEFAIDSIRVANQTLVNEKDPDMGFVQIRVGFHSGPVVSNVVGTRNPRFCLFGDTVNTANRMESNSQMNRIHCSEISATLLREQCPKIRIYPRGEIEVKGKGTMKTFWIHEP